MEERTWSKAPQRRRYHHPSFSSTLLDAIYRSIDDDDDSHSTVAAGPSRTHVPPNSAAKKSTTADRRNAPASERSSARRRVSASGSGLLPPISTSSSSDNSSYGGFSSSEPESATVHPSGRLRPIRTAVDAVSAPTRSSARIPPLPPPKSAPSKLVPSPPSPLGYHGQEEETKKKTAPSIRSKLRDLRKSKTPASPGARLAGFINSLFASASGKPRKPKGSPAEASSVVVRHSGSACSAAPSYSRSCLVNTPSSRGSRDAAGKRSVRFFPVSVIVDEDLRPCGQKSVYEEDLAAPPRPSAAGGRAEREAKRRAEELLRRQQDDDDDDDGDGGGSDSSSDLFELEIGRGAGAGFRYRDELPVYETTNHHIIGSNRPISHIF